VSRLSSPLCRQFRARAKASRVAAQLYSTASYRGHDLRGIFLSEYTGLNLAGQRLTRAVLLDFDTSDLTGADTRQAWLPDFDAYPGDVDDEPDPPRRPRQGAVPERRAVARLINANPSAHLARGDALDPSPQLRESVGPHVSRSTS
jgi:hypothetical protein